MTLGCFGKVANWNLCKRKLSVLINSSGVFCFLRRLLLLWIYGWNFAFSFHPPCYNLLLSMKGENRLNYAAIMQKYILPGFLDVIVLSTFYFTLSFPLPVKSFSFYTSLRNLLNIADTGSRKRFWRVLSTFDDLDSKAIPPVHLGLTSCAWCFNRDLTL